MGYARRGRVGNSRPAPLTVRFSFYRRSFFRASQGPYLLIRNSPSMHTKIPTILVGLIVS